jgi:hypothetical protein
MTNPQPPVRLTGREFDFMNGRGQERPLKSMNLGLAKRIGAVKSGVKNVFNAFFHTTTGVGFRLRGIARRQQPDTHPVDRRSVFHCGTRAARQERFSLNRQRHRPRMR